MTPPLLRRRLQRVMGPILITSWQVRPCPHPVPGSETPSQDVRSCPIPAASPGWPCGHRQDGPRAQGLEREGNRPRRLRAGLASSGALSVAPGRPLTCPQPTLPAPARSHQHMRRDGQPSARGRPQPCWLVRRRSRRGGGRPREPPQALCSPDHCLGEEPGAWTPLRGQGVPGEDSPGWGSAREEGTHLTPGTTLDPSHPAPPRGCWKRLVPESAARRSPAPPTGE